MRRADGQTERERYMRKISVNQLVRLEETRAVCERVASVSLVLIHLCGHIASERPRK